ncbi:MAG: hypothetical protein K0B14_06760 [Anaerolineaceae bacterium]|nr:hypothetical protein [Anaerolineaceae bacterium]
MTPIAQFLELNRNLIQFFYGLVFFSLGLTTALQSRSYSRLELARSLKWLAVFGLIHGLCEWGELLILLQSANLNLETIFFWPAVQLLALGASFAALFMFGVSLTIRDLKRRWLYAIPASIFVLWGTTVYGVLLPAIQDQEVWRNIGNALARYFLSLPGGLLSALALHQYTRREIAPLNAPHIVRSLHTVKWILLAYALLSGLVPPPAPFFPANWLNTQSFFQLVQIPVHILRSVLGLSLAVFVIRSLEIFDVEYARRLETIEQEQILSIERGRIARELHDGALQAVYTAGLLVESAVSLSPPASPLAERLDSAISALDGAIQNIRRNLVEMTTNVENQPFNMSLRSLIQEIHLSGRVHVYLKSTLPEDFTLPAPCNAHVQAIVRDALVNVIRHANASQAEVLVSRQGSSLALCVEDDGCGMPANVRPGYGLRNISDRARLLGGQLKIASMPGKGVLLQIVFPWEEN